MTKTGSTELSASVEYQTVDGTAVAPGDYTAISATALTFEPAETSKQVTVLVNGDSTFEANEIFTVHRSEASRAGIASAAGAGTIVQDNEEPRFAINDASQHEANTGN